MPYAMRRKGRFAISTAPKASCARGRYRAVFRYHAERTMPQTIAADDPQELVRTLARMTGLGVVTKLYEADACANCGDPLFWTEQELCYECRRGAAVASADAR